ncbi:hypothetical protein Poli38472_002229 [Pythium oligandrum]|uniref:IPT/TIG domain-containing protein n=1 Tax=Pythium oligandrum TaxID=41045 RepID=A0A8K1CHX2_PYTOL|nr:hypothetical protein Poli38472_002229 [Pythium oligandrum]|eukprot:TMW63288.1 hypothetical protein Poli38472_002229 [Pythium oligandrum]
MKPRFFSTRFALYLGVLVVLCQLVYGGRIQSPHLMWSASPLSAVSHSGPNAVWTDVLDTFVDFELTNEAVVLISFDVAVSRFQDINDRVRASAEESELAFRIVLDGLPYRQSGTTVGDHEPLTTTASGYLATEVSAGVHKAQLQWRKLGDGVQTWYIRSDVLDGFSGGRNLIVSVQHEYLWSVQPLSAASITSLDEWEPVTDMTLHVRLTDTTKARIFYKIPVRPQLIRYIRDASAYDELVTVLEINGLRFRETGSFGLMEGSSKSSLTLEGSLITTLDPGDYSIVLLWKRFPGSDRPWFSAPSATDGFGMGRILAVVGDMSLEKVSVYNLKQYNQLQVGEWSDVGDSVIQFSLPTTSFVRLSYNLPLSQKDNPQFSSWSTDTWNRIQTRLVIDGIAYRHLSSYVDGTVRGIKNARASMVLSLAQGTHTARLQWQNVDGSRWKSVSYITDHASAYASVFISVNSWNNNPVVQCPSSIGGMEDTPLVITSISISDSKESMALGYDVTVRLSVQHGVLTLSPTSGITYTAGDGFRDDFILFSGSLSSVNTLLSKIQYESFLNWYGSEELVIYVSEQGSTGYAPRSSDQKTVVLQILSVNDPPHILVPSGQYVTEDQEISIFGVSAQDVDVAQAPKDAVFEVQLYVLSGVLSLGSYSNVEFLEGDGNANRLFRFRGDLQEVNTALFEVRYRPDQDFNSKQHMERIGIRLIDYNSRDGTRTEVSAAIPIVVGAKDDPMVVVTRQMFSVSLSGYGVDTYPTNRPRTVQFRITTNGTEYSAPLTFSYTDAPRITRVQPVLASAAGGDTITIFGENFADDPESLCWFGGTYTTSVVYVSSSQLKCSTPMIQLPNGSLDQSLKLALVLGRTDFAAPVNYTAFATPVLERSDPMTMSGFQEELLLYGRGFRNISTAACVFESSVKQLGRATYVNDTAIKCTAPIILNPNRLIRVFVTLTGELPRSSPSTFVVVKNVALPVILKVSPLVVTVDGGQEVSVEGTSLSSENDLWCEFKGAPTVRMIVQTSTRAVCVSPAFLSSSTYTQVAIVAKQKDSSPKTLAIFQILVLAPMDVVHISPSFGLPKGGNRVVLVLKTAELKVLAQNLITKERASAIEVSVSVDGVLYSPGLSVPLSTHSLQLIEMSPSFGPASMESNVWLSGDGFDVADGPLMCVFGASDDLFLPTTSVNRTHAVCQVPPKTSNDGWYLPVRLQTESQRVISNSLMYRYTEDIVVDSVLPKILFVGQNCTITLQGTGFQKGLITRCVLLDASDSQVAELPLIELFWMQVACVVEVSLQPGTYEVGFTVNSGDMIRTKQTVEPPTGTYMLRILCDPSDTNDATPMASFSVTFTAAPIVHSFTPQLFLVGGSFDLELLGAFFAPFSRIRCEFYSIDRDIRAQDAVYVSSTHLRCKTPYVGAARRIEFAVVLTQAGGDSNRNVLFRGDFQLVDMPKEVQVNPDHGIARGTNFVPFSAVSCRFGSPPLVTRGVCESVNRVRCRIPPSPIAKSVRIAISFNSVDFIETPQTFEYVEGLSVRRVTPTSGEVTGGTVVNVFGGEFRVDDQIECFFGEHASATPAAIVSMSQLQCITPPVPEVLGAITLRLESVRLRTSGSLARAFQYTKPVLVKVVSPGVAFERMPVLLDVFGVGFVHSPELQCVFKGGNNGKPAMNVNARAMWVSESQIKCSLPSNYNASAENVRVGVTNNAQDVAWSPLDASLKLITRFDIESIYPSLGSRRGGTPVQIRGKLSGSFTSVWCRFGQRSGVVVSAMIISSSEIECATPALNGVLMATNELQQVSVELSVNGKDFISTTFSFQYVEEPHVHRVSPVQGTMEGSTTVTITGTDFIQESQMAWCRFGEQEVRAMVRSSTELVCVAPANAFVESVALEVSMNDGVDYTEDLVQYRYVPPARIRQLSPLLGPVEGGTLLTISGHGFYTSRFMQCCFGSQFRCTLARLVRGDKEIRCRTPISVELPPTPSVMMPVTVLLTLNGQDFVRLHQVFEYYSAPVVERIEPSFGEATGGTPVLVRGRNFRYSVSLSCRFGMMSVQARFINDSQMLCLSPPGQDGVATTVAVTLNGQDFSSSDEVVFTYVSLPLVFSVTPPFGLVQGGTELRLRGSMLPLNASEVSCVFEFDANVVATPAIVDSETSARCISPRMKSPGTAMLTMTMDGIISPASRPLPFNYFAPAVVQALKPWLVESTGGSMLTLYGHHFVASHTLACCFSSVGSIRDVLTPQCTPGTRAGSSKVRCVSPALLAGAVDVVIQMDGVILSDKALRLQVHNPVQVFDVSPHHGSYRGNTSISVVGANFLLTSTLSCCFETIRVSAAFVNSTMITCTTPPFGIRSVSVQVSLNGQDCHNNAASAVLYNFTPPATIARVVPAVGTVRGGTRVAIHGENFVNSTSFATFGSIRGDCIAANASFMACQAPEQLQSGTVHVAVTSNGVDLSTDTIVYTYWPEEAVTKIAPTKHVARGNGMLTVDALHVRDSNALSCFFGQDVSARAVYQSSTRVYCPIPQMLLPGVYGVSVSNDGVLKASRMATLELLSPPLVVSMDPVAGYVNGGQLVTIQGARLDMVSHCRFGELLSTAVVFRSEELQCLVPASGIEGVVDVHLVAFGVSLPSSGFTFKYLSRADRTQQELGISVPRQAEQLSIPIVRTLTPSRAPTQGGTRITVDGLGFSNSMEIACRFGDNVLVKAEYRSAERVVCRSPRTTPGRYTLQVTNDGMNFSNAPIYVDVYTDAYVESISPRSGPRTGGTAVTVYGMHFLSTSLTRCRFGDQGEMQVVKFVSSSEIVCLSPPQRDASNVAPVVVMSNNASFTSNPVFFTYTTHADIVSITPRIGSIRGGTELLIKGYDLEISERDRFVCRIGTQRVNAHLLTPSLVRCITPAVQTPGKYDVQISTNGQDFTKSRVEFEFIPEIELGRLAPSLSPALDASTVITVYGSGFLHTVDLACFFDGVRVLATWESSNEIRCATPRRKPGRTIVRVTNNGVDKSLAALPFYFVRDVSITRIRPSRGPIEGGTPVFIQGRNFLNATLLACRFAEELVVAKYISESLLVCVAPRQLRNLMSVQGRVSIEVTLNHQDFTKSGLQYTYLQRCPVGHVCMNGNIRPSPNGTISNAQNGGGNFTLCAPGLFQPRQGQLACLRCPVGFYCSDYGMTKPVICPAGMVCDTHGLRIPEKQCPSGHYCRQGTKTTDIKDFMTNPEYLVDKEMQLVSFLDKNRAWSMIPRLYPAIGSRRIEHPPIETTCDLRVCDEANPSILLAERPYACPVGMYCRRGVTMQQAVTKNFTTPQKCFAGFFCPRGSSTPEGSGPCPTGHYCPSEVDAIVCPAGHYCPGVGNIKPRQCYPGTYNPSPKQSSCTLCPTGYICPQWAMLAPVLCPAGFVCISTGLSAPALLCPPGYICSEGTRSLDPSDVNPFRPMPCPKGTYCLGGVAHGQTIEWLPNRQEGAQAPQVCTEGTYCEEATTSASGTSDCFSGHYCPPGSSFPIQAPVGSFSGSTGSVASTLCFPGTYTPLKATVKCEICPAGHTCPGYGTYIPTICPRGLYRSLADSITCRPCPEGTWSPHTGVTDVSFCEMCPPGRVCGSSAMSSLSSSLPCAAGYVCGEGTNRRGQFDHLCPGGHYCHSATTLTEQYANVCERGNVCVRGTKDTEKNKNKCPDGKFCPLGTANMTSIYIQCPSDTWTGAGRDELLDCVIRPVPVCDKRSTRQYYPQFQYHTQGNVISYDSTVETDRTGEVQVARVVYPVNESASVPFWRNDSVDALYACPPMGSVAGGMLITVFGTNFLDTGRLACSFQLREGGHVLTTPAFYVNSTRVTCRTPPYTGTGSTDDTFHLDIDVRVSNFGRRFSETAAAFRYISKKTMKSYKVKDEYAACLSSVMGQGEQLAPDHKAWFALRGLSKAKLSFDFRHIPPDLVYDEHYKIAIFVKNSTCEYHSCDSRGVIHPGGPEIETWPCLLPVELPNWFMSTDVDKHDLLNITLLALEDVVFKIEIHITYGLYTSTAPLFVNSTVVQIKTPVRSNVTQGLAADTRPLSRAISNEEELVTRDYLFLIAYFGGDGDYTSPPLNLPPKYREFERGRVLVSHNVSSSSTQVPLVLDSIQQVKPSSSYWVMPYGSAELTHQMAEKYRETFHEIYLDPTDPTGTQYLFKFEKVLLSYVPFISNCMEYDSYMPLFDLLESDQCQLPDMTSELGEYGRNWWRRQFPSLPNQDDIRHVGPLDVFQDPVADLCQMDVQCNYEEDLPNAEVTPRWFEQAQDTALYYILREPTTLANYFRGGAYYDDLYDELGSDYFIPVTVDNSAAQTLQGDCSTLCFPRHVTLDIAYYQLNDEVKRIIKAQLIYENYDRNASNTAYTFSVNLHALSYFELIIQFAFERQVYVVLFIVIGGLMSAAAFIFWLVVRLTTFLESPPRLRFWSVFSLIAPPPSLGVVLACVPVFGVVMSFYVLVKGDKFFSYRTSSGYWFIDSIVKHYMEDKIDPEEVDATRNGRMGLCFLTLGLYLIVLGSKIFLPKSIAVSEKIIHEKNDVEAKERNIWWPTQWKRANMIYTSIRLGLFLVLMLELSFWSSFGDYMFYVIVATEFVNAQVEGWIEGQLKEALLMAPLVSALSLIGGLMTFGATDFGDFVMGNSLDFGMMLLQRVYVDVAFEAIGEFNSMVFNYILEKLKKVGKVALLLFRSFTRSTVANPTDTAAVAPEEGKKEGGEEKKEEDEEPVETVEPIIDFYAGCSMDRLAMFYQPVLILLMMFFREEVMLPILYNIREKDMEIYLWYSLIILAFQLVIEVFVLNAVELFQGWKLYDYLVYCRYRFLQREHRWKGMEPNLDECIEENLRTLDQMCFSSQLFMMCTIHITGMVFFVVAIEIMARARYNLFGDPAMPLLAAFVLSVAYFVHHFVFWLAVKLEFWKIKHENTAWLAPPDEDDEFGVPRWDELEKIKGASHEAYLMNQRITSETFRFKFLNYNRSWIVNQLPSILTPRTLRRARPYLLAQFAKILDSLNPQVSEDDDADDDGRPKFGPVTLSASSRTIIRLWLARARRIQRLKSVVQPIIQQARKSECEMCLSRRQLQVELAIPIEILGDKFEAQSLAEEFDAAGWKEFFVKHEKFKTICLNCIAHLRETEARGGGRGFGGAGYGGDGYGGPDGDWGQVQLNAASYALMQKWYKKAQDRVFGKHGGKRRNMVDVSDDEEEVMARHFEWTKKPVALNAASTALARKWIMTARQSLRESGRMSTRIPENLTAVPLSVRGGSATPVPKPAMKMGAAGGEAVRISKMRRK